MALNLITAPYGFKVATGKKYISFYANHTYITTIKGLKFTPKMVAIRYVYQGDNKGDVKFTDYKKFGEMKNVNLLATVAGLTLEISDIRKGEFDIKATGEFNLYVNWVNWIAIG